MLFTLHAHMCVRQYTQTQTRARTHTHTHTHTQTQVMPVDDILPALYSEHPRQDINRRIASLLAARAPAPAQSSSPQRTATQVGGDHSFFCALVFERGEERGEGGSGGWWECVGLCALGCVHR